MDFFEIPTGDPHLNHSEIEPPIVDVYVYRDKADVWCKTKRDPEIEGYLMQIVKAVPTPDPIFITDECAELEVGDVFCLDEEDLPTMRMKVVAESFLDPKPKLVIVIEKGMVRSAHSLTGDDSFAYAVIDLDIKQEEDATWKDIPCTTYVVDGIADSVEDVLSEL